MDALKYFVYIIICLKAETFANERSETYARLLQRIDALEKRDRESRSEIERLDRRMNAQSKTIKYQAEQIKHLQEITKNGMSWKQNTYHATRSNTKKIHTIPRNLVRSYMFQHNVNNDKPDAYSKQGMKKQKMPSLQFETNKASKKQHAKIKREDISILPVTQPCLSRREIGGIAFSAYLDHDLDLGAHQTIKFNKVLINDGSGYDTSSGVFTCPEAGVYMFTFFVGERAQSAAISSIYAELMINSQNSFDAVVESYHLAQDLQGGNVAIKRLNSGDTVWIDARSSGHAEGGTGLKTTTFSGLYLYP